MQILVSGQHIVVGDALQTYGKKRVQGIIDRYLKQAIRATIHFMKENARFICDIIVYDGNKSVIKSSSTSHEAYESFNIALSKLEAQLKKHKSKIKDHRVVQ
jgi:ribosomal subunit interface protein